MKSLKWNFVWVFSLGLLVLLSGCNPANVNTSSLYVPTNADVTSTATLQDLQQGRDLFIGHCCACHQLYTPETYNTAQWQSIVAIMAPRTNLTSAQTELVLKYLTKGHS